jgi:hypothetical protein
MAKEYDYFIFYQYDNGYGNSSINTPIPIKNLKDIKTIEKMLTEKVKEEDGVDINGVCITHFQLF